MSAGDDVFDTVMSAAAAAPAGRDAHVDRLLRERIKGWDRLDVESFPDLHWAVPGLIPEGYGLLVAPPKAGKSWMVLDFAVACAAGGRALDAIATTGRPVLYLALEDGDRRLQDRLRVLAAGRGVRPTGALQRVLEANALEADIIIGEFIAEYGARCPLIILDTIGRVMPGKTGGENEYQRDYRFGAKLKGYAAAMPGGTLLGVHHTNKGIHADFQNAVSGTQGIAGAADFTAVLNRPRGEDTAILSITGRDIAEAEYAMRFDGGLWNLDGGGLAGARNRAAEIRATEAEGATRARLGDRMNEIIAYVNAKDGAAVAPAEVAKAMDLRNDIAGRYLNRAAKAGHIRREGRGKYVSCLSVVDKPQVNAESGLREPDTRQNDVQTGLWAEQTPEQGEHSDPDSSDTLSTTSPMATLDHALTAFLDALGPDDHLTAGTIAASFDQHPPATIGDRLAHLATIGRITATPHGYGPRRGDDPASIDR